MVPPKTHELLCLLERSEEENRSLRDEKRQMEREHEEEFVEYEKAMRETISKKDECIAHMKTIIENLKMQRGKDSTFIRALDLDVSR